MLQLFKKLDAFGTPVSVNYRGEQTYNSICGGVMTISIFTLLAVYSYLGTMRMINRDTPEYASYFLTKPRDRSEALNIPERGGQMYIGLKQWTENADGSIEESFIPFDRSYINAKIDYRTNGLLEGRVDLPSCTDQEDFASKI